MKTGNVREWNGLGDLRGSNKLEQKQTLSEISREQQMKNQNHAKSNPNCNMREQQQRRYNFESQMHIPIEPRNKYPFEHFRSQVW
jgi:hypothetical protein